MEEIETITTAGALPFNHLAGISSEALLETVLARLAGSGDRGAAIAQAAVEEALRQLRKRRVAVCGGESDAR